MAISGSAVPSDTYRAASTSPAWQPAPSEAWWYLWLPIVFTISLFVINAISADFYLKYMLPEGYGFLEVGHFFIPMTGFVIALMLYRFELVRGSWLLKLAAAVFAFTCLYIAGEEMSWGQHFFYWNTPEYWTEINRQAETNLHNVSPWFNQRPRLVLEIGIMLGGIVLPLWQLARGPFENPVLALFVPPPQILPISLCYLFMKGIDHLTKRGDYIWILGRPNEAVESMIYLFLLFYMIIFYRRVRALDAAGVRNFP